MDLNTGNLLIQFVGFIVTLIPIGIIVYNQGRKDQKLEKIVEDLKDNKINITSVCDMTNKHKDFFIDNISELKAQIGIISVNIERLTMAIEYIQKELKKEKKS